MNNLIQSLTSQRLKVRISDAELKRLLATVKESRGHDAKLADAFYDSLEGILLDLRTVTSDNRDAEAFLKPVSKTDYSDYYEIIQNPMDLQTMLKKVKQKQYKSKLEFADDLQLIWDNCFKYNNSDNHPLRQCAARLREKANRLLSAITDRRDRIEPPIPFSPTSRTASPKPNGIVNGRGHSKQRSSHSLPKSKLAIESSAKASTPAPAATQPLKVSFPELPAYERTAEGMSTFMELDRELDRMLLGDGPREGEAGPSRLPMPAPPHTNGYSYGHGLPNGYGIKPPGPSLVDKLSMFVDGGIQEEEPVSEMVNGIVGEKRKLLNGDSRPRKRPRHGHRSDRRSDESYHLDLWWEAVRSQGLMSSGLPTLTYASSDACEAAHQPPSLKPPSQITSAQSRAKRRKKKKPPETAEQSTSLLSYINSNIRTQRRIRRTHDKFLALNLNNDDNSGMGPDPMDIAMNIGMDEDEATTDVQVDERPWRTRGTGLEIGQEDASACLNWAGHKIIEHAGFQSASKSALDVFTGVMAEYLLNVGRTIRYLCDKYSTSMNPEEIILHTLFESGITHIRDLERYITDDVIRYGSRLTELEKKLVGAYREVTAVDAIDDDALFGNEDDEEEDSEFVMGGFADAFGEDFFGFRELGIAGELGVQSLSIPKKLLRNKKNGLARAQDRSKPTEPPPPYPPHPEFVPLSSTSVENQIGLLKPYYMERFNKLAASQSQVPPPFIPPPRALSPISQMEMALQRDMDPAQSREPYGYPDSQGFSVFSITAPTPSVSGSGMAPIDEPSQSRPEVLNPAAPPLSLPDDTPQLHRTKIGPLGQVIKPNPITSNAKKKSKAAAPSGSGQQQGQGSFSGGSGGGGGQGSVPPPTAPGTEYGQGSFTTGIVAGPMPITGPIPPGVTSVPGPAPYYHSVITPSFSTTGGGVNGTQGDAGPSTSANSSGTTGTNVNTGGSGEGKKKGGSKKKSEAPMPHPILASA